MSPLRSALWRITQRTFGLASDPYRLLRKFLRNPTRASFELRLAYDAIPRPSYAYGVYHAAVQASALGIPRITAIEFGVGPGGGLLALEDIALQVEKVTGVGVDVIGFDTGTGMPAPLDYRDLPYRWAEGEFRMDPGPLRAKLRKAELVLGNVRETARTLLIRRGLAPIGFISFDLDYYSSTKDAMVILDGDHHRLLPRIFCHVDDIIGDDREFSCEYVGELLAIKEFNETHDRRKLAPIFGLAHKRVTKSWWNDTMHMLHVFDHPLYEHLLPTWWFYNEDADRKLTILRDRQRVEREAWLKNG